MLYLLIFVKVAVKRNSSDDAELSDFFKTNEFITGGRVDGGWRQNYIDCNIIIIASNKDL